MFGWLICSVRRLGSRFPSRNAAEAKETRLGNAQLTAAQTKGAQRNRAVAEQFAANVLLLILPLKLERANFRKIAEALKRAGRCDGARRKNGRQRKSRTFSGAWGKGMWTWLRRLADS